MPSEAVGLSAMAIRVVATPNKKLKAIRKGRGKGDKASDGIRVIY